MYMSEMIKERRESQGVERHDLFSNLLASCDEEGEDTFTEKDLMGISI
jgi:cytochrome P450